MDYDQYSEYNTPPPHTQSNGLKKAAIIAACIALLALGISVGGFFILRGQSSTGQGPTDGGRLATAPSPTPAAPSPEPEPVPTPTPEPQDTPPDETAYEIEPGRSIRFPFPGTLSRNASNAAADVVFLQNTLNSVRRNFTSIRPIDSATGSFGGATFGAVADFQLRIGLPTTGIVDEDTWYSLMSAFENPPASPDPAFTPPVQEAYATLVGLHLRETPSQEGESLGVKPEGTLVWVVSYIPEDSWFFVSTEYGTGYMKAEFLILDGILQ